jgi:hypothetical protein
MAYYDHRHSGIYGTNILQVMKQAEGEKLTEIFNRKFQGHFTTYQKLGR